jgi:hypothetical protein
VFAVCLACIWQERQREVGSDLDLKKKKWFRLEASIFSRVYVSIRQENDLLLALEYRFPA